MAANAGRTGSPPWGGRTWAQDFLPKLVLAPSLAAILIFVYGFIFFTGYLSFTNSKILPNFDLIGFVNYEKLFGLRHWSTALTNLAIFGGLYIIFCTLFGLLLAIFLDQKIRGEGVLRPIYLYPMALSFIVTGTAWKWFLDPGIGLEQVVQNATNRWRIRPKTLSPDRHPAASPSLSLRLRGARPHGDQVL